MMQKRRIAGYIVHGAVLLLAVLLIGLSALRSARTEILSSQRAAFSGEYSLDGGGLRPLSGSSILSGRTLTLRGSLAAPEGLEEGARLRFYLDHTGASLSVNGVLLWEDCSDADGLCGRKWSSFTAPAILPEDVVEITLTNCHAFGNGYAFRSFIDNIYVCADGAFETYMLRKSLPERLAGFVVIAVACVLIGLGFGSVRRGDIAKRLFHWGAFAMFAGAYLIFDTINFSMNFGTGFGMAGRFASSAAAGVMFSLCVADPLRGRAGAAARGIGLAQCGVVCALFALTAAGVLRIYTAQYLWIPLQACAALGLIVCAAAGFRSERSDKTPILYLPMLAAWVLALANAVFGLCVHGLLVKAVFLLTFAAFLVGELRKMIAAQRSAERARELERELKMSRIVLATSQIRSHFIFNVLNAISGMCKYDPRLADETVVRFARYLRSNVDILGNDALTPISTELKHVDDYICLEQMRFGSRIEFIAEMETEDFPVPPLILQPLVENAVKHGILPKKSDGMIRLRVYRSGGSNIVTVTDDGVGFDTKKPLREGAVGLENVRFRLETMVHGTLEIISAPNEGTTITITIPRGEENAHNLC